MQVENLVFCDLFKNLMIAMDAEDKSIQDLISLVSKSEYLKIRKSINEAFCVDSIEEFYGRYCKDTELGDITDTFVLVITELYPPEKIKKDSNEFLISFDDRKKFRDTLIEKIDNTVKKNFK